MVNFFEHIPSSWRTVILISGLVLLWILEGIAPRFHFKGNKYRHAGTNLFFTLTTVIINTSLAFLIVKISRFTTAQQFGLLYLVKLPLWLHAVLAVLMLDFMGAWLIHWVQHKNAWLWQFHKIHHIDTEIDATTALRHHPVESIWRVGALFITILVMGIPFWMIMLYQSTSAFFSQFNHANIRLPQWLDNSLSWVIVSPDMHKVHHSDYQPETDTNYANIFSIWDRIFGTFKKVDVTKLRYGLEEYQGPEYEKVSELLKVPWERSITK
ncbi:Sterol desaturase/sphingolipid hydroxylase, fatty acid hydroxylase superfamily [Chitinophaga terrae (ex Kim and Jung 2007)]|uniref:Sterol desaturase/sphingolipid hydroxylase, fatty acid hydroxylase superfamily n=1 Tax=Chitinophaga terrae (ex Kim and Jung 2007) TaxID=408074 RepID=A0A1H4G3R3_9BACT|nr:sterol desaturase family protein [Chitinophaga terrae (ex Kim and Jung 2007)]MDQ0109869.1 sterol desaturase/sphingolipid hydroxylase (fatty acid hydroxylase superfamily) [Chitinophaga terrae (ex Kim and Jung 2007)]GEP92963.1 sterol desaturase [Chitinophaga terrae (ex Kim and Jung 2007)]SEB04233.1 Sterol desaturase/sphingolipid hydroxylase, fatty acid hydroxylase superfamily [Chitinophaga terrae (ex Kim and Jung 2007)]